MFRRAYPGPSLRQWPRECPLPIPTTPFPPPYDSHFPPQTHKWSMRFPTSRPVRYFVASRQSQGTSPHRPAPSDIKAGVSEALQPLRLLGKLRSCLTCWFNAFLLADRRWGGGAVHRHDEQITHTPFVQSRGYWMASEAKGKPGHQPIGFRCGWASSLRTSEHLLVQIQ